MKRTTIILTLMICICAAAAWAQAPQLGWQLTLGGGAAEILKVVQPTLDGGYIVGGPSVSDSSGEKSEDKRGWNDYWVVKLDASRNIEWERTLGGNDEDILCRIITTADSGYLLAGASKSNAVGEKTDPAHVTGAPDLWLVKLDKSGAISWQKTIGGDGYTGLSLMGINLVNLGIGEIYQPLDAKQTDDGGFIVATASAAGISGDKTDSNRIDHVYLALKNYVPDCWILRLDASGNILWQKTIGGDILDAPVSIYPEASGGYIVGAISCSNATSEKADTNRTGHVGVLDVLNGKSYFDYWIYKLDDTGKILWQKTIGGDSADLLTAVIPLPQGGYIATGSSNSTISGEKTEASRGRFDYWVVKLDDTGRIEWQKTIGGGDIDLAFSTIVTADSGILLSGMSFSDTGNERRDPLKGFSDYWLVKLTRDGDIEWQKTVGGTNETVAEAAAYMYQTPDGNLIVGGISSAASSGDKTDACRGDNDYWIFSLECSVDTSVSTNDTTLTATEANAAYQWLRCSTGLPVAGATQQSFTPDTTGDYRLLITRKGCVDTSGCYHVEVVVGINDPAGRASGISLYPNPASRQVSIRSATPVGLVRVVNMTGVTVLAYEAGGKHSISLELGGLATGIYTVQMETPDGPVSRKLEIIN